MFFESEYQRERNILPPIGMPEHCVMFLPVRDGKMNRTTHELSPVHCPSFCGIVNPSDAIRVNHVPELAENLEIAIPENIDVIETSTTTKVPTLPTPTTKFHSIGIKTDSIDLSKKSINSDANAVLNNTVSKIEPSIASHDAPIDARNMGKKILTNGQVEKPFDIAAEPVHSTTAESVQIVNEHEPNSVYDEQSKLNKTKEMHGSNGKAKQSDLLDVEPVANLHADQTKFMDNDIKTSFKKYDKSIDEAEAERAANIELMKTLNEDGNKILPSPQPLTMSTSPSSLEHMVDAPHAPCFAVDLHVRSDSFNTTLGSDEICHNFNITYNIPISKYMEEKRIHLVFV